MFEVQDRQCATCIYRPDSSLDLKQLEAQIADPKMQGYFKGFRSCHHAPTRRKVCCRGFWNKHKDHFTAGQLAQRLNFVRFVHLDNQEDQTNGRTVRQARTRGAVPRAGSRSVPECGDDDP